jgi:hypothetical protein
VMQSPESCVPGFASRMDAGRFLRPEWAQSIVGQYSGDRITG